MYQFDKVNMMTPQQTEKFLNIKDIQHNYNREIFLYYTIYHSLEVLILRLSKHVVQNF